METTISPRVITIISASTNSRKAINSSATTLGELKAECRANGIETSGMVFYEGITKTEMTADDAQLPTNVQYRGETTNNLVFLLTLQNKKVKSGALSPARAAVLNAIKNNNLSARVVEVYGDNATRISTENLLALLEQNIEQPQAAAPAAPAVEDDYVATIEIDGETLQSLVMMVNTLSAFIEKFEKKVAEQPIVSPYSDDELDALVNID